MTAREVWRRRLLLLRAGPPRGVRGVMAIPVSREAGSATQGARMLAGQWHFAGHVIEAPRTAPWDIAAPSGPFEMQLHGQGWLDDLMAVGTGEARRAAQDWVIGWARRYGRGAGPGWGAATTGRRLLRWIGHAPALLRDMEPRDARLLTDLLYRHAGYLRRMEAQAPAGLPRMEALAGLLHADLALDGLGPRAGETARVMVGALYRDVDADGGLPARNPEALLELAVLLGGAIDALAARGTVPDGLMAARARIVPTLRALRHADGGLARFHGGGRGRDGRLDRVLVASGIRARRDDGLVMGFTSLVHGRTTLIVDAAAPPEGVASGSAHASTCGFEMTSGGCPVIVSCGPGGAFGPDWHRAGRATASHSTLSVDGYSSSRIGAPIPLGNGRIAPLVQRPARVQWQRSAAPRASTVMLGHDGWGPTFGLTHLRRLSLSTDGRLLRGEDSLRAMTNADKQLFDAFGAAADGIPFHIRFHLHPEARAATDMGGRAVSVSLPSGEVWVFRPGGGTALSVEPSVHLEPGRLHPRPARQVVLSGRAVSYAVTVEWSLTLAQGGADGHAADRDGGSRDDGRRENDPRKDET